MTTSDTDEPTEAEAHEAEPPCPVCGNLTGFVHLDDGTTYCPAHRGLTVIVATADVDAYVTPTPLEVFPTEVIAAEAQADADEEGGDEPPWPLDKAIQMVAGLCFDAALATFHDDGTFGDPPTGWAPPPADQSPYMEAGVCLALATLIEATECDREVIQKLADIFCGRTPTTEGESND